jgi:hypothetical protein
MDSMNSMDLTEQAGPGPNRCEGGGGGVRPYRIQILADSAFYAGGLGSVTSD